MLEPSSCLVRLTHAASGIQINANTKAPQMPPPLWSTFFGNYSSAAELSQPYFRRKITNLFELPEPRPSRLGEPAGTMPTTKGIDCQTSMLHQQAPGNTTLVDGIYGWAAPRPTVMSQPQEVPGGGGVNNGHLSTPSVAPQVVPDTDMRPRDALPQADPIDDGATVLRDRRLAEYEARLKHSQARPTATTEIGDERSDLMVTTGGGILSGARHGHLLHPICASRLADNVTDSPRARHQQRTQKLNGTSTRSMDAIYGNVHYRERGMEQEGPVPSRQFAPRLRYQASMEIPDDASKEDAQNLELMPLARGMGTQAQPPHYGEIDHHGERRSRRDWYQMLYRAPQECEPHVAQYEAPRHLEGAYVPTRAKPVAHLAKMQDFQGEENNKFDSFFDHVEELADFYRWDEREMVRQARAHIRGTALAYELI